MENAARNFDALIEEFYEVWFRFHPIEALSAGVSGYEGGLPAVDDDETGALGVWLESSIVALEELDFNALDDDRRLDLELLFRACQDEHHALLEYDWRHRDPVGFLPIRSLHQLVLTPQVDLRGLLGDFLGRIPEYLRHARSQLSTFPTLIPHPWVEAALLESAAGVHYLAELRDGPLSKVDTKDPGKVRELCDQVGHSLTEYNQFLEQEIAHRAQGLAGCGRERFEQRMRLCHFLEADPHRLLEIVRELLEQTRAELQQLCMNHSGYGDAAVWVDALRRHNAVDSAQMLDFARECNGNLRDFILSVDLFDIPASAQLRVEYTPSCFRPGVCAPVYVAPVPGDSRMTGTIYLSPESGWKESITAHCIRSGWGGYHLQSVTAAESPVAGSLVRRLVSSATMSEGWKLYTEQLLFDQGFAATPEQSLVRLLERLRRLLLAALDVEVHVDGLAVETALERLEALPGGSPEQAALDLMRLTRMPTESLAGVLGWRMLEILRKEREEIDAGFEAKVFHGNLLRLGTIALPMAIRRAFGQEQWESIQDRLGLERP